MPFDDNQKKNVSSAFTAILRQSPLAGKVDVQRLSLAMYTVLEHAEGDGPVDLMPIYQYLVGELKLPELQVMEILVVLKSRESALDVPMQLPGKAAELTDEQRATIVEAFLARATPEKTEKRPEPEPEAKPAVPGWTPDKRKKGAAHKPRSGVVVAFTMTIVAVAGLTIYQELARAPPPREVHLPHDVAALSCDRLTVTSTGMGLCYVRKAMFEQEDVEAVRARGQLTKASAEKQGVDKLFVITAEDNRVRLRL